MIQNIEQNAQKNFSLPPLIKRLPSAARRINGVPVMKDG